MLSYSNEMLQKYQLRAVKKTILSFNTYIDCVVQN